MKITKRQLKKLIKESWASYGVDPVQFLIDFFQGQDVLMGTEQVEYMLSKEGWLPEEIDAALNDPRLDNYYEEGDDSWGASEVPYAPPHQPKAGGPRSAGNVRYPNPMHEGRMAAIEMQLADEIIDLLIERGAIPAVGVDAYMEAHEYLAKAILPVLKSISNA